MKVALIETHAVPGVWKYDLGLAKELSILGADVTIVTSKSFPDVDAGEFRGAIMKFFPNLKAHSTSLGKGITYILGVLRTIAFIRSSNFDIIHWQHFNTLPPAEALLAKALKILNQRTILTIHDVDPWAIVKGSSNYLLRTIYHSAERIILHHKANEDPLARNYGVSLEKVRIVPHGSYADSSADIPDRIASRQLLGLPEDAPIVLFFGEIRPEKGLIHLIRSMRLVHNVIPNVKLVIAGRPRHMDMSECLTEIENLGLEETVVLRLGYIEDGLVGAYFSMTDLVALPYIAITQSGVLFEAMTAGCPVVATDIGAIAPTVRDVKVGRVVSPGESKSLAYAILEILQDPELAQEMGQSGRRAALEQFSWSSCAKETMTIYRELKPETEH